MQNLFARFLTSGEVFIFIATFVAGLGWVASKEVIQVMPAAHFIGIRFLLAAIILLPFCFSDICRLSMTARLQALGLGILLNLSILIWIYALSMTDSMGEGAFIMSSAVLMAPLVSWVIFNQKPQSAFWFALPIAIAGIACLSLTQSWQIAKSQLFFIFSALLSSLHFSLNKHFTAKINTPPLMCLQMFGAGCLSYCLSLFQSHPPIEMTHTTWFWLAVSILLSTSLRYTLQTMGQHRTSTASASIVMIMEPIWVLLLSMLIYQEKLPPQKLIGCLLIITALLLFRYLHRRQLSRHSTISESSNSS